ncbi:MAG: hypothetical protein Q3M24_08575 [Candidatus Electrothrix aestuarii]|uniref:Uncharacterized protein n=1 Tax=Candidatus Electrothrix aestuarii TaxID=3062594 RepID=A0AAU8LZV3_9BACT|nr:hypothetical protein [Candidatus Electrothrix aestuarii]
MKKTILMFCSVVFLCVMQMEASAQNENSERIDQGQRGRVLSPVTVEEVNFEPLTEKEKRQIKKKVLQKLEIPGQGGSIGNPILPNRWEWITAGGRKYYINVTITSLAVTIWVDPVIAVGYDYTVEKGPKFTAVELPKGIGDNQYDLWVYQNNNYVDSGVNIEGGALYQFKEPVSNFSIRGIEPSAELDPANETAFPTGLRFEKTGKAVVTMTTVTKEN